MRKNREGLIITTLRGCRIWFWAWTAVALVGVITRIRKEVPLPSSHDPSFNNFRIFRGVFWHTIHQQPLYVHYPTEYNDLNHYGVLFSLLIAPFAVMPLLVGVFFWVITNTWLLYYAIKQLDLPPRYHGFIYFFALHELFMAVIMQQFNIGLTALIILSYVMVEKEKDKWATFFIVIATLTKLYGIVGLAFFFFSKDKKSFIGWGIFWLVLLFVLPMTYTSPAYVWQEYVAWFHELGLKNTANLFSGGQNMGFIGFVRKLIGDATYSDVWFIAPALLLVALPYMRKSQYTHQAFRMMFLASVLLFVVLFSTGTEHSGYIIGYVAVPLWFILSPQHNARINMVILLIAFLGTFMVSDLMPRFIRNQVYHFALKSIPVTLVWLKITYDLFMGNFAHSRTLNPLSK